MLESVLGAIWKDIIVFEFGVVFAGTLIGIKSYRGLPLLELTRPEIGIPSAEFPCKLFTVFGLTAKGIVAIFCGEILVIFEVN